MEWRTAQFWNCQLQRRRDEERIKEIDEDDTACADGSGIDVSADEITGETRATGVGAHPRRSITTIASSALMKRHSWAD